MNKKITLLLLIVLTCFVAAGCRLPWTVQSEAIPLGFGEYNDIRRFSFEPETILADMEQNKSDLFLPIPEIIQENVFPWGTFPWMQQDYLNIAYAVNQVTTQDTLEDWNLLNMSYGKNCSDNPSGFDDAEFTYFRFEDDRISWRKIIISPLSKEVDWGGNTRYPRPFLSRFWGIDLDKLKITAEAALQIAEVNGGQQARAVANNHCKIFVGLSALSDNGYWYIHYYYPGDNLFDIYINPYSGDYQFTSP